MWESKHFPYIFIRFHEKELVLLFSLIFCHIFLSISTKTVRDRYLVYGAKVLDYDQSYNFAEDFFPSSPTNFVKSVSKNTCNEYACEANSWFFYTNIFLCDVSGVPICSLRWKKGQVQVHLFGHSCWTYFFMATIMHPMLRHCYWVFILFHSFMGYIYDSIQKIQAINFRTPMRCDFFIFIVFYFCWKIQQYIEDIWNSVQMKVSELIFGQNIAVWKICLW